MDNQEAEGCLPTAGQSDRNETSDANQISIIPPTIPPGENPQPTLTSWLKTFEDWGHAERLPALDGLIKMCDLRQIRHVEEVIDCQLQDDSISSLPKELALYLFSFLEPADLLRAAQTCRYWNTLAENNILWREKCQVEDISESLVFPHRRRLDPTLSCKSLYLRQRQIEHNWRTANTLPALFLIGEEHQNIVITCLEFSGNKIVSGTNRHSEGSFLKLWNAETGKLIKPLFGHTDGVWSLQMSGDVIISGSSDRTVRVWIAGVLTHIMCGHTLTVRCLHLYKRRVVSGSRDHTLRLWDIDTGRCLHVLTGHTAPVRCVQYDGHRIVSGSYDNQVKIWNPETGQCLKNLSGHTDKVYSLQFNGVRIVSGSVDGTIRVWNGETGACQHTLIGQTSRDGCTALKGDILLAGGPDYTVKVWNIVTGQCLQNLEGPNKHQQPITDLQFHRSSILTSSNDGSIKLWDIKSGEFIRDVTALSISGSEAAVWRIRCNNTKLVCGVGSRDGSISTKLLLFNFDVDDPGSGDNSPTAQYNYNY